MSCVRSSRSVAWSTCVTRRTRPKPGAGRRPGRGRWRFRGESSGSHRVRDHLPDPVGDHVVRAEQVNYKGLRPRFAVVPTNGRACLKDCLMAISPQVDSTILVYTVPWKDGEVRPHPHFGVALRDVGSPNISRWWNEGLDICTQVMDMTEGDTPGRYDVAILNDDVIVPPGWFDAVSDGMRMYECAAACSGAPNSSPVLLQRPGPVPLHTRLQGFAFILAGEKGIRANEELRWYF